MMLSDTLQIAASGLKAESDRLRVVAENLANANAGFHHDIRFDPSLAGRTITLTGGALVLTSNMAIVEMTRADDLVSSN